MSKKIIYASDLDRTLIFSNRFLQEYPSDEKYSPIEIDGVRVISYMSDRVRERLNDINKKENIEFIPVTTRSANEYNRINFGFIPEYAIIANGGRILYNGKILDDWEEYIRKNVDYREVLDLRLCVDNLKSVDYDVKFIDNRYLFFKTDNEAQFDYEVEGLAHLYPNWQFTRQRNKCYIVPKSFSKAIALRWLQHRIGSDTIIASGDSQLDLPMLAIANYAVVPDHGNLIKENYVLSGRIVTGGIISPLETFDLVEKIGEEKKWKMKE